MSGSSRVVVTDHLPPYLPMTALETSSFPSIEVSELAEQESWRKEINRPLYHIHKWWATRLGSVFRAITLAALRPPSAQIWEEFYKHHTLSGKTVLDPFMGSGTTLGEALKLGASVVGCDINPISTFLVRQALARVPESKLLTAFNHLQDTVAAEIGRYYQTTDPESGETLRVLYFFWVKVLRTPEGEDVPLFSRYVFAQDAYAKKKPRAQIVCPSCWKLIQDRFDATDLTCRSCAHRFNPQVGPARGQHLEWKGHRYRIKDLLQSGEPPQHRLYGLLALKANGEKIYLQAMPSDIALFEEASRRLEAETELPLPVLAVRPGHNTDQARGYNYTHWRQFFNDRQLLCLGLLLRAVLDLEDLAVQEQMLCLFSSTLEFNNMFCSFKGEGTGAVRHMFSNHILKPERTPLENSVWGTSKSSGTFSTLFTSRLLRAKRYLDEPFEILVDNNLLGERLAPRKIVASDAIRAVLVDSWAETKNASQAAMVLNGNSASLPLPDRCVDAVITDPPYFDFVHYSELSDFFFAWLAPALKSRYEWFGRQNSSHAGEVQHSDSRAFASQLSRVFKECSRVLKDDGVLAFSFHHSRPDGWAAIHEALRVASLNIVAVHPVHAELRAATPKAAALKPISLDAILVCRKASGSHAQYDESAACDDVNAIVEKLRKSGVKVAPGDRFVIAAGHALMLSSGQPLSFEEMSERLEALRRRVAEEAA